MEVENSSCNCSKQEQKQSLLNQGDEFVNSTSKNIIVANNFDSQIDVPFIIALQDAIFSLESNFTTSKEIIQHIKENAYQKINNLERFSQSPTQILSSYINFPKKRRNMGKKKHKIIEEKKIIQNQNQYEEQVLVHIENLSFPIINYFFIFGVLRYDTGFDLEEYQKQSACRSKQFKVIQIEKKHSRYFLQLIDGYFERENKNEDTYQYEMLTRKLESLNNKIMYEKAQMIKQLGLYYDQYNKHLELVRIFYANDEQKLRNLQNLRIEYMKNEVMKLKKKFGFDENDFIVSFYFSPDFAKRVQAIHSLEVNLPFISLIGVTGDEFVSIVLRDGISCWFGDSQSGKFNNAIIKSLQTQQNYYEETIYDQELKTIDGFSMKCSIKFIIIKNIFCEDVHSYLPMQLNPPLDLICLMRYEIEIDDIKKLLDLRSMAVNIRDTLDPLINTLTYTVNSEAFVEKFYGGEEKIILNNQENDSQIQEEDQSIQKYQENI